MRPGDVIELSSGARFEVLLVNASRARVRSLEREKRNGKTLLGVPFSFDAPPRELDISPGTEARIVRHKRRKVAKRTRLFGFVMPEGF